MFSALPRAPTKVRISDVTATSVRLAWSYDGVKDDLDYYVIQYKPRHANQNYSEISGVVTEYYTITQLSPYTQYEFIVRAINNIGRGPPSLSANITTGETGKYKLSSCVIHIVMRAGSMA